MKKVIITSCICSMALVGCASNVSIDTTKEEIAISKEEKDGALLDVTLGLIDTVANEKDGIESMEHILKEKCASFDKDEIEGMWVYSADGEKLEVALEKNGGAIFTYKNTANSFEISYREDLEKPVVRVFKEFDTYEEKAEILREINDTEMQKKYAQILKTFNGSRKISDIEEEFGVKFEQTSVGLSITGGNDSIIYELNEGNEGILVTTDGDYFTKSIMYNNAPEDKIDVKNYEIRIDDEKGRVYSIEMYRDIEDMEKIEEMLSIIK